MIFHFWSFFKLANPAIELRIGHLFSFAEFTGRATVLCVKMTVQAAGGKPDVFSDFLDAEIRFPEKFFSELYAELREVLMEGGACRLAK